jgi:hypothetical protein
MDNKKIILFIFILILLCAKKMPPPGKPDIDPPDVEIVSPLDGDSVIGEIEVKINANDKSKIIYVELFVDDKKFGVDSLLPYIFKFSPSDSVHFLRASAIDEWENIGWSKKIKVINKGYKFEKQR